MPHQEQAVSWLLKNRRGLLAHEPGCGKTLTALETINREGAKRVLVVAPAPLLSVWRDEAEKWYGRKVVELRGSPAVREKILDDLNRLERQESVILVCGYETLRIDFAKLKDYSWDALIYDETLKIQNHAAKVTKCAMQLKAPLKIALNGTPISNSWADLWPVMTWLEPLSLYGNFYKFRGVHAIMNPYFPAITGWRDTETIKLRTAPLMHVRRKRDVLDDLPDMTEQTVEFELSAAEKVIYRTIKDELRIELAGEDVPIGNALVKLLRLRQAANGLFAFGDDKTSSKLDTLEELLEKIPADAKVLVFTSFKDTANEIKRRLGDKTEIITGDSSYAEREESIARFRSVSRVLVGTDAIAYGITLTEASYVIMVDLPFSYAKYEQRIGRAWRKGQKNAVTVYNLEASGTVDAHVSRILQRKLKTADEVTSVTRDDLRSILDA